MLALTRYLRGLYPATDTVAALDAKIKGAEETADPGERIMRFREIAKENLKAVDSHGPSGLLGLALLGSVVATIAGAVMVSLPVFVAGAAVVGASFYLGRNIGSDANRELWKRLDACMKAQDDIAATVAPKDIANSPRLEQVLKTYPELKERFLAAVMREKFPAPAPQPAAQGALKL